MRIYGLNPCDIRTGDRLFLSGKLYTARDAAHKRMLDGLKKDVLPPFDPWGQIIYYTGPSPAPEGKVIGAVGPTTSYRMDAMLEPFLKLGLRGTIGKGQRDPNVKELVQKYNAPYFVACGGAGALLSKCVESAKVIAYEDLGAEAIFELKVENFPVTVAYDVYGGDIFRHNDYIST